MTAKTSSGRAQGELADDATLRPAVSDFSHACIVARYLAPAARRHPKH